MEGLNLSEQNAAHAKRAAVVFNPTKVDRAELAKAVADAERASGWGFSLWLETSAEDPGAGMARQAVEEGCVWRRLVDTSTFAEPACNYWNEGEGMIVSDSAMVAAWSVIVWQEQAKPDGSRVIPVWKD